jgi:23S rRNA pseudouridine1911/1915/1917 synthase
VNPGEPLLDGRGKLPGPGSRQEPGILAETRSYLVVYKSPLIHSVPLKKKQEGPSGLKPGEGERTLLDWCVGLYPELRELRGRGGEEGGILHRLDYETRGLVLFARTPEALEDLSRQQEEGLFIKEYQALSAGKPPGPSLPGFPLPPEGFGEEILRRPFGTFWEGGGPRFVESPFRPYGPGRRAVRPLAQDAPAGRGRREYTLDRGRPYRTEIWGWEDAGICRRFFLGIARGFRHQIRCHLSWIGFPLLNDRLYGGRTGPLPGSGDCFLALRAEGISFRDPLSRERREYRLSPGDDLSDFRGQVEGARS